MSSLFGILSVARSALQASQLAIQTATNNVANAGTPGYSRQRVDLNESLPENLPVGQVGTGVTVNGIRRYRNEFFDRQFAQAQQALGERQAQQSTLEQIEAILNDPSDQGLQASLSRFFSSLHDLASYPGDLTTRRAVLEQGRILAGDLNRLNSSIVSLKRNIESELQSRVGEANTLLGRIATLNGQIQAVTVAGGSPNALLDQRDQALDDLANLVNITRTPQTDGTVHVSLTGGGGMLVNATTAATLGVQLSATSDDYQLTLGGTVVTPRGGKITGLLNSRNDPNDYVKYAQGQLDALTAALIERMNRLQAAGSGTVGLGSAATTNAASDPAVALGSAGLPFALTVPGSVKVFVYDAAGVVTGSGTVNVAAATTLNDVAAQLGAVAGLNAAVAGGTLTVSAAAGSTFRFADDTSNLMAALGLNGFFTGTNAATIAVNAALDTDPRLLSTGAPDPVTGVVAPGDNSTTLAMARLRETAILAGGTATPHDFYAATIGVVGARTAAMNRQVESQDLVARTIQNQRDQVAGVSLNEEMTELIRFQHSFEAAARMIRAVDDMLDTVVNGMLR